MANYREEHIRNNRRLARQVVGAAALLLALIGLFTVLGWIVGLVRAALDDTDLRNEYRDRLYGMVMLDPVAFDDVNSVDEGVFKQAAIWGTCLSGAEQRRQPGPVRARPRHRLGP